jgi:hypothetical protein
MSLLYAAEKDETKGMGSGWERFEFDKDAPLDDEEIEGQQSIPIFTLPFEYVLRDKCWPCYLLLVFYWFIICIKL